MKESHPFGRRIREKRLGLLAADPSFSLRRLAARLGIQPSYLSRLERGAPPSLSEDHILALAAELDEPADELLALAGKLAADVRQAVLARPGAFAALVRELAPLPDAAIDQCRQAGTLAASFLETQRLARVGSFYRDLVTGRDFWSEEFRRIFKLPPGEPTPTFDAFLDLVHPEDREIVRRIRGKLLAGVGPLRYNYRFRRSDGLWRHAKAVSRAERDASGRVAGYHGTVQDVTAERQALENLRSIARFPEDNPHPVLRIGRNGLLAYANKACAPLLDALNMAVGAPAPAVLADAGDLARKTGAPQEVDLPVGEARYAFIMNPHAASDEVNGYGYDVGRERRDWDAQRLRVSRFRQLFDDARLGLFRSTLGGRILWVSQATAGLFGYASPEAMLDDLGHDASKVFAEPDKRPALLEQLRRDSGPHRVEIVYRRRDGTPFIGRLCARLLEQDGEWILEGFLEDITAYKRALEAVAAREERLKTHLRNFPLPTLTFALRDRELVLLEANKAAEALFRGRIGTCLEAPAGAIFDEAPDVYLSLWSALEARRTSRKRLAFRPPGAIEPGIFDMTFVFAAPDTVMLHAEDVTDLERAREDVRRTVEQLRAILDHVPYAASLVGSDGRTLFLNKAFVDIVGYSLEEIPEAADWLAKAYPDPQLRARIAADWEQTLGKTGSRIYPVRCGDGITRRMDFTAVPLPDGKMLLTMRLADEEPPA
jgi:PAS domain S-box-containing protein